MAAAARKSDSGSTLLGSNANARRLSDSEAALPLGARPQLLKQSSYMPHFRAAAVNPFINLTLLQTRAQNAKCCVLFVLLCIPRLAGDTGNDCVRTNSCLH